MSQNGLPLSLPAASAAALALIKRAVYFVTAPLFETWLGRASGRKLIEESISLITHWRISCTVLLVVAGKLSLFLRIGTSPNTRDINICAQARMTRTSALY